MEGLGPDLQMKAYGGKINNVTTSHDIFFFLFIAQHVSKLTQTIQPPLEQTQPMAAPRVQQFDWCIDAHRIMLGLQGWRTAPHTNAALYQIRRVTHRGATRFFGLQRHADNMPSLPR